MTSLKRIGCAAALSMALVLGLGWLAFPAQAGYVVTLGEVGNDVVATGSGPIDLTGLHFSNSSDGAQNKAFIFPSVGNIITGPAVETMQDYYNPDSGIFVGPTSFGSGFITDVVNGSGDIVGILQDLAKLIVPEGYVSGAPLKNIAIYNDQSFDGLGVTAGTYVWTWGTGPDQNFTLVIPALSSVLIPEPASAALLGMALAGLLLAGTHRRVRHP